MKNAAFACLALAQIQPTSLSVPPSILNLAQQRIIEQASKQHGLNVSFDKSGCSTTLDYQIAPTALIVKADQKMMQDDQHFSFQDLLDGRKIQFSFANKMEHLQLPINSNSKKSVNYWPWLLTVGAIGIGMISLRKSKVDTQLPVRARQYE